MSDKEFRKGGQVEWKSRGNPVRGRVEAKTSAADAVHRPDALRRP